MSFFGGIFGTVKAVDKGISLIDKTVGHIASGFDQLVYTDEEKSADSVKLTDLRIGMVKSLQDQFTPRSISRRIFAGIILGNFYLHANLWLIFVYLKNSEMVTAIKELLKMELQIALLVCFFYFGYYGVKSILKK